SLVPAKHTETRRTFSARASAVPPRGVVASPADEAAVPRAATDRLLWAAGPIDIKVYTRLQIPAAPIDARAALQLSSPGVGPDERMENEPPGRPRRAFGPPNRLALDPRPERREPRRALGPQGPGEQVPRDRARHVETQLLLQEERPDSLFVEKARWGGRV